MAKCITLSLALRKDSVLGYKFGRWYSWDVLRLYSPRKMYWKRRQACWASVHKEVEVSKKMARKPGMCYPEKSAMCLRVNSITECRAGLKCIELWTCALLASEEVVCESDGYKSQTVVGGGESGKWRSRDHLHRRLFLEVWLWMEDIRW